MESYNQSVAIDESSRVTVAIMKRHLFIIMSVRDESVLKPEQQEIV